MSNNIVKPSILPGFMELTPKDQIDFNMMLDTIKKNYEKYGFVPMDTPIMEKTEVLLAKGGGETEKQIYRFTKGDSDISLRFDLTVPFARFVAQNMSSLNFPFRRYQIGKVYRGERNQKGRFREFYQCDIDIIGNGKLSIVNDAEIPAVIYSIFKELGFENFKIRINNRKILNGFFKALGIVDASAVLRSIDKLDKIGEASVKSELLAVLEEEQVSSIMNFIMIAGSNTEVIEALDKLNIQEEEFTQGLNELETVVEYIRAFKVPEKNYMIDLKIARGLDYYTGTVYETILDDYPSIGSVCSGGRYENLAEYYTNQKLPGVGISIGLTRLFYQLREAKLLKSKEKESLCDVIIIPMDGALAYSIDTANKLREAGIVTQVYFEEGKLQKKLNYTNKLGIPYVILIGDEEMQSNILTMKVMSEGQQYKKSVEEAIDLVLANS
ncbi:histidine--tRNA ligase [Clostridium manihotivorum]|uniref:Histidine--tRNA ligase n=1 Tax=Clostridium manihotivorum TaxID=2320868 RepID=A0A410DNI4_9CLOT|nr:histidine--tRNA ligase [Clostridium manihotivorum]QAA30616.1 histidine--tRNA ligase [Clostridium manihotivorum]